MISKENFYNTTVARTTTVYYILDHKRYSPKEFNNKMNSDGFTPKKTDSGIIWERTISILRNPNNSLSHARGSIYPNNYVYPLVKKHAATPFQDSGFRLPVIINQRTSKNDQKAKPIESKKTGIYKLQESKIVSVKKSDFIPFQGAGHRCNPAAPRLEKEAIRDLWNNKYPQSSNEAYQMINDTLPFNLIRQQCKLLEKIKKEDYHSAIYLIKKLETLVPKTSISIKKSYENLLQQAYHKTKSAQEIAKETLSINPLALSNISKAIELMGAPPGKSLVVHINYQEEQRRLAQ